MTKLAVGVADEAGIQKVHHAVAVGVAHDAGVGRVDQAIAVDITGKRWKGRTTRGGRGCARANSRTSLGGDEKILSVRASDPAYRCGFMLNRKPHAHRGSLSFSSTPGSC